MIRAIKVRLFPTKEQEKQFWEHINASRFIYNYMLSEQNTRYEHGEKHMSRFEMIKLLPELKKQTNMQWLCNVSNHTLQRSCTDLSRAFDNFFKKRKSKPVFKTKKRSKKIFPLRQDRIWFSEEYFVVPKIGKVKYKTNYDIPFGTKQKFIDPRIQYTLNNKWILTIGIERDNQAKQLTEIPMGVDLGVKELAIVSFGNKSLVFHNINKSHKMKQLEKKLKHLQRNVSRKYKYLKKYNNEYEKSRNILKEEEKIRKLYYHMANIRNDYRHKVTHNLVSMLPCRITMEDLDVSKMLKNKNLSKQIKEQGFYDFITKMRYKCEDNGIPFIQADRFFPSSKMCSECGSVKSNLKLSDRTYVCDKCGCIIDRDLNAAKNLAMYIDLYNKEKSIA